jgi:hypothetical protein
LSGGNFPFYRSAHGPRSRSRRSTIGLPAKEAIQFAVELGQLLLDGDGPLELGDGEIGWIHAASKYEFSDTLANPRA